MRRWGQAFAVIFVGGACGGRVDPPATANVCVPGQQVECACPGVVKGAQPCREDGSGYGVCQCPGTGSGGTAGTSGSADASTGGSSGASGSGGRSGASGSGGRGGAAGSPGDADVTVDAQIDAQDSAADLPDFGLAADGSPDGRPDSTLDADSASDASSDPESGPIDVAAPDAASDRRDTPVVIGCNAAITGVISMNHGHALFVAMADILAGSDKIYNARGTATHDHWIPLYATDFTLLKVGGTVVKKSCNGGDHECVLSCGVPSRQPASPTCTDECGLTAQTVCP
ncbi:MAG TPA: hypothetical protein VK550_22590 [Polyangiaceae bacterium]|nr:hypothetical protein [Polyangiaceae bacterium]